MISREEEVNEFTEICLIIEMKFGKDPLFSAHRQIGYLSNQSHLHLLHISCSTVPFITINDPPS